MSKHTYGHWQGRPIADPEDVHDLEQRAAIHEFNDKMPRHEAEEHAYVNYVKEKRLEAAAHHLAGMKAAHGTGNMDEARKHGVMYELHLKALGLNPAGPVPPEVSAKAQRLDDKLYHFKPHAADLYALQDHHDEETKKAEFEERGKQLLKKVSEDVPRLEIKKSESPGKVAVSEQAPGTDTDREMTVIEKAEMRHESCDYTAKTTHGRCKNPRSRKVAGRYLCHWHADLAAKEDHKAEKDLSKAETVDRSEDPTVLEYAKQHLFKGKGIAGAVRETVKTLHGGTNVFIGPGVSSIDPAKLEHALVGQLYAHASPGGEHMSNAWVTQNHFRLSDKDMKKVAAHGAEKKGAPEGAPKT